MTPSGDMVGQPKGRTFSRKIDNVGAAAVILFGMPFIVLFALNGIDRYRDWSHHRAERSVLGKCIDVSPMRSGRVTAYMRDGEMVKISQVDTEGRESVTFASVSSARNSVVPCA